MTLKRQFLVYFCAVLLLQSCGVSKSVNHKPQLEQYNSEYPEVQVLSDTLFVANENHLIKNKHGLWELKVSGDPLEIGKNTGALTENLLHYQEEVFFNKVEDLVPSKGKQKLLRGFLKWYNRKLYQHVPEEYKTEIYGVSRYASDKYNHIAPRYLRSLYLHAAHDIGHALQDLALVGCSSLAVWDTKSEDSSLLLGRNFDFYAGDAFAENKIVAFVSPEKGHSFMSVTWAGMIGVVSGMNTKGITVTINAGKSEIPLVAKTPISIVAREILQYAATIEEAIAIAKKREVFVAESIMVGSAADKKAIVIEVSPENFGVYDVANSNQLLCTNHFQSEVYKKDKRNSEHIEESHSKYRFDKMEELLVEKQQLNPQKMAAVLRNTEGLKGKKIGYGNEKALNQLLAHHGIIFKPETLQVWVSANPYQLGAFVAYDLHEIFTEDNKSAAVLSQEEHTIAEATFLRSKAYKDYEKYREMDIQITKAIRNDATLSQETIQTYQSLNPEFWEVHYKVGIYFYNKGWLRAAELEFKKALQKEITTLPDRERVKKYIKKINRKR